MFIDYLDNRLTVVDIGVDTRLLAGIPSKLWSNEKRKWLVPMVKLNEKYLSETAGVTISEMAKQMMTKALKKMEASLRPESTEMPAVQFKLPPMKHQMDALCKLWPVRYGGLFSEPGTGKSKIALDLAAMLLQNREIDGIIIVCPTSLKKNWEEQLRIHMSAKYWVLDHVKPQGTNPLPICPSPVAVFIIGSEALSTKTKALEQAIAFNKKHKAFTIFDESHFFKNHTSMRTKNAKDVCGVRALIMTGTPISQGIQDLYGQFALMSTAIVGAKDFFCFRNRYCVMGGFKGKQIIGQTNVGELVDILDPFVFQVLKKDCLDLPDKVYQKRLVKLNPKQKAAYSDALENVVNLPEEQIDIENVLVQCLHLQQITGGFVKHKEKMMEFGSEKLAVLEQIVEGMPQTDKMVVFARYLHEIEMIVATLKPYGGVSARHGLMTEEDKDQHVKDFRTGPNRFFVTSQMAGGTGLTLVEASTTVFYSNTFSMTERTQSEDRCLGAGTRVLTATGYKAIEDIEVGDEVVGGSGKFRKVTDAWCSETEEPLFELWVRGAMKPILATADHRFLTTRGWLRADQLKLTGRNPKSLASFFKPPDAEGASVEFLATGLGQTAKSVHDEKLFPEKLTLDEETLFVFGYYLGDGFCRIDTGRKSSSFVSLAGNNTTKATSLERCKVWFTALGLNCNTRQGAVGTELRFYSKRAAKFFSLTLGRVCKDKSIPEALLQLSVEQSKWLMAGLVASDGYIRKGGSEAYVEYVCKHEPFACNVLQLALRCGYKPSLRLGYTGQHVVGFNTKSTARRGQTPLALKGVVPAGRGRAYDITVEEDESFVLENGVVAHNCHRIGTTSSVLYVDIVAEGTVDERVLDAIGRKMDFAQYVAGLIKAGSTLKEIAGAK